MIAIESSAELKQKMHQEAKGKKNGAEHPIFVSRALASHLCNLILVLRRIPYLIDVSLFLLFALHSFETNLNDAGLLGIKEVAGVIILHHFEMIFWRHVPIKVLRTSKVLILIQSCVAWLSSPSNASNMIEINAFRRWKVF